VSVDRSADRSPIALWDAFWSANPTDQPPTPAVRRLIEALGPSVRGARVLELGAGTGRDIVAVARAGAQAYADDRSSEARAMIAERARSAGVEVTLCDADLRELPYDDGFFDAVYSVGLVEHFTDVDEVLREQCRVVRPGGLLAVDVPQTFHPWTVYKHLRMWRGTWPYGWETQYSLFDLRRFAKRHGLVLRKTYGWGEHLTRLGALLDPLDRTPLTAMCIGAIYQKPRAGEPSSSDEKTAT
jgi:SAM-dependent methyltransferase